MIFEEELSEYELIRAQNVKELEAFVSDIDTPDLGNAISAINSFRQKPIKVERKKRKRSEEDETFRFTGIIPLEMRRSARLSNVAPQYSYLDLPDEDGRQQTDYEDIDSLETIVFRKKRSTAKRSTATCDIVPVEAITPEYLGNIAKRTTIKVYSQTGTSCHQCRQKTTDSKTYCRSGRCIGVRGQFCGVCLKNRYGEEARDALLNPRWECPPCRGLCNCSICRTREGKRPTGILAPVAFRYGHKSVKDFLISLNGKGDYRDGGDGALIKDNCTKADCPHIDLLGFTRDSCPIFVLNCEENVCDMDYDLIGFSKDLKPVVID